MDKIAIIIPVVISIIFFVATVIIIAVVLSVFLGKKNDSDDDNTSTKSNEGGGIQVGGTESVPFFAPANERAGILGEKIVNRHLRPLLREDEYLLANLLLPLKNGHKTEIDCVLISRRGIFCIETKNWVGNIKGNDEDEYWIQKYDDPWKADRKHKNPVHQNEEHCQILERILHKRFDVENVVIFVSLEYRGGIDSDYAFTIREFENYYYDLYPDVINEAELKPLYQKLVKYVASEEELKQHKEDTRKRYN